jgi:hypothetical protein
MAPLSAAFLLLTSLAVGGANAAANVSRLDDAAAMSQAAAAAPDPAQARDGASAAMDGGAPNGDSVADDGTRGVKKGVPLTKGAKPSLSGPAAPPPPAAKEEGGKLSTGLMMGGAAALGGLQGYLSAGLVGAAAGAGLGLAAAWLFHKKDYGGAFGLTAGAIIGTAFAGPLGGLIGAAIGGIVGHFLGKLFL